MRLNGIVQFVNTESESEIALIENKFTHFFESRLGVKQGGNLSPNLFKIFINSLPDYLEKTNDPISIEEKSIHCLMYADDIVLLSKSSQGLQEKLNKLKDFCNDWCLNINIKKTKVLVFNKAGKHISPRSSCMLIKN